MSRFPGLRPRDRAWLLALAWAIAGGLASCRDRTLPASQPDGRDLPTIVVEKTPEPTASAAPEPTVANAAQTSCSLSAYVIDTDPNGLNVRAQPNSNSEILDRLPTGIEVIVDILASQGNWVLITLAESPGKIEFSGQGWVYAPLLGTATQPRTEAGVKLYTEASASSPVAAKLPVEFVTVSLLGCKGPWAKVKRDDGVEGWLAPDEQCPNPFTTCP